MGFHLLQLLRLRHGSRSGRGNIGAAQAFGLFGLGLNGSERGGIGLHQYQTAEVGNSRFGCGWLCGLHHGCRCYFYSLGGSSNRIISRSSFRSGLSFGR